MEVISSCPRAALAIIMVMFFVVSFEMLIAFTILSFPSTLRTTPVPSWRKFKTSHNILICFSTNISPPLNPERKTSVSATPPEFGRYYQSKISSQRYDFNGVLRKCRVMQNYEPAIALADEVLQMRPIGPAVITQVIKVFGEAGQLGRAISMLRFMENELQIAPSEHHLGALIHACKIQNQWEMALELYHRMDQKGIDKNTIICNSMISTPGDALQWKAAFDILGEMTQKNITKDTITYSSIISACVKAGEWRHAITLYKLYPEKINSTVSNERRRLRVILLMPLAMQS